MFFQQTAQRDQEIDEALDRVHQGVKRLGEQAKNINYEIKEQNKKLEVVDQKMDTRIHEMKNMNRKLKQNLDEVKKDKFCCYLICLLMLIGILGVIASYTGVFGGD